MNGAPWALDVDQLRLAALTAEPIPLPLPPPAVRRALRQGAGVSRHHMATVLCVGYRTFERVETGTVRRSRLLYSVEYRRLLGVFAEVVRRTDPSLYNTLNLDKGTDNAAA